MSESTSGGATLSNARAVCDRLLQRLVDFLRREPGARERLIALLVSLLLFAALTTQEMLSVGAQRGDEAIFLQLVENIGTRGVPVSEVFENTQTYLESGLLTEPAQKFATSPLAPPRQAERNMLGFHMYLILYPIAVLAKFLPVEFVLCALYALAFVGMLTAAFFYLRRVGVPVLAASLFCLLVISQPAWSLGILGQFFPDRLFVLVGFLLMCLVSAETVSRSALLSVAILGALISERASALIGAFLLMYVLLYWRRGLSDRHFKLGLGAALLVVGLVTVKLLHNPYYSGYLPTSIGGVISNFTLPGFAANAATFVLVNLPLLLLALFEWRAALIAAVFMLPNLLGNVGGAEKTGWVTPYHSYYFPALVWAAMLGYTVALRKAREQKRLAVFYSCAALLVIFINVVDPGQPGISAANVGDNFLVATLSTGMATFSTGMAQRADARQLAEGVPDGVVVTTVEAGMPLLYHARTIRMFPVDVDHADFAVLDYTKTGDVPSYSGVPSYLDQSGQTELNALIQARMRRDRYDFARARLYPTLGLAVIVRRH